MVSNPMLLASLSKSCPPMKMFWTLDSAASARVIERPCQAIKTAIIVLQHPGGELGFDRCDEPLVAKEFEGLDGISVERRNSPRWIAPFSSRESFPIGEARKGVAVLRDASDEVLEHLERVKRNERLRQSNKVLARNGKPLRPLEDYLGLPSREGLSAQERLNEVARRTGCLVVEADSISDLPAW